jgi:iron complex transport system substrate-binding protein
MMNGLRQIGIKVLVIGPCLFLLFLMGLTSCKTGKASTCMRLVTDMAGRTMSVPDSINRVFATRPGSILLYVTAPEKLVARSLKLSQSAQSYLLPAYDSLLYCDGAAEDLVRFKPAVIVSFFSINERTIEEADRLAAKTGIPVFMVDADLKKYATMFDAVGDLLGCRLRTDSLKKFTSLYLDTIFNRVAKIPAVERRRVYYAEGTDGLQTDPRGSIHSEILDWVGADNVAKASVLSGTGMTPVSYEQLLIWKPDLILCWTGAGTAMTTYSSVTTGTVWKKLKAVREGRVYQIPFLPFGWFDRPPGPNRILGAIWTAHLLYPSVFNYDIEAVTVSFFDLFYHYHLDQKELTELLSPAPDTVMSTEFMK